MRCVVSEVQQEGGLTFRALFQVLAGPGRKEIRRVSLWFNYLTLEPHVVSTMSQMGPIVVHHVAEKPMKVVEAALDRRIRRFQAKMPFTDDRSVITGRLEEHRQELDVLT